jgi:hypothetical protein
MLKVTIDAKKSLRDLLKPHYNGTEKGVRVIMRGPGQFDLVLSKEAPEDHVVEYDGLKILLVGPELINAVDKLTFDSEETTDGLKFFLRNSQ